MEFSLLEEANYQFQSKINTLFMASTMNICLRQHWVVSERHSHQAGKHIQGEANPMLSFDIYMSALFHIELFFLLV